MSEWLGLYARISASLLFLLVQLSSHWVISCGRDRQCPLEEVQTITDTQTKQSVRWRFRPVFEMAWVLVCNYLYKLMSLWGIVKYNNCCKRYSVTKYFRLQGDFFFWKYYLQVQPTVTFISVCVFHIFINWTRSVRTEIGASHRLSILSKFGTRDQNIDWAAVDNFGVTLCLYNICSSVKNE
jgi:hypothetical protein